MSADSKSLHCDVRRISYMERVITKYGSEGGGEWEGQMWEVGGGGNSVKTKE